MPGRERRRQYRPSVLLEDAVARMRQIRNDLEGLRALDLACGGGRNSICLAEQGFQVDAVDLSAEGLALAERRAARRQLTSASGASAERRGAKILWIQADLDAGLPVAGAYDLIVMIRYLDLPLLTDAIRLLQPGGVLVVELHMDPAGEVVAGPGNPDFLVSPGVLAETTGGLTPWLQTEGIVEAADGRLEALARFIGCV